MSVYDLIWAERQRQDRLHPATVISAHQWMSVLGEEVGEAHQAANERDLVGLREELVQVAAVAVRIVELMDAGRLAEQRESVTGAEVDLIEAAIAYHDQWAVPSSVEQHRARHAALMDAVAALLRPGGKEGDR